MIKSIIILMFTISTFQFGSDLSTDENLQEIKTKIEKLNKKFVEAFINEDLDSYLSLYTDDAIVMPPFASTINGKDGLVQGWYKRKNDGISYVSATTTILEIWTEGNLVYERGSYGIHMNKMGINNPFTIYGSYFTIWEKQKDNTYKMKYNISNLDHKIK